MKFDKDFVIDATQLIKSGLVENSVQKERISICENCDDYIGMWIGGEYNPETKGYGIWTPRIECRHCGCNMPWKTKFRAASCPLKKWDKVLK